MAIGYLWRGDQAGEANQKLKIKSQNCGIALRCGFQLGCIGKMGKKKSVEKCRKTSKSIKKMAKIARKCEKVRFFTHF